MNSTDDLAKRYSDQGRYFQGQYDERALAAIGEGKKAFPFRKQLSFQYYEPRPQQRYLLIADQCKSELQGTVLDVGSRNDTLQKLLGRSVQLVDKNNPALSPFDWEKEHLPYSDSSFDVVVCLDTLEHINDFHASLEDLVRVARSRVVISLPNCWRKVFKQMLKGSGEQASYGLPLEKPMDRHRWFFNSEDVENFFFYQAVKSGRFRVVRLIHHMPMTIRRHHWLYPIMLRLLPERLAKNLMVNTVFVVLEKMETTR